MLSERDIELAHPDSFDFVFGNLPSTKRAEFSRHRLGCRYCQGIVDEYSEIGTIIKDLPPHVEPPAALEDRAVAAMVAALAGQRAELDRGPAAGDQTATRLYPVPEPQPRPEPQSPADPETQVQPRPQLQPPAEAETRLRPQPAGETAPAESQAPPVVTPLPVWRRYRSRLAAVVAVAAAIIAAAIVIPLGRLTPAQATVVIPLHVTAPAQASGYGAATGQATARQDASGSWDISLTVQHLKSFGDSQWYQCWYISRDRHQVASAGTFQVPASGSRTFSMTAAADPRDFRTMEITIGPPSKTGALQGTVVLSGQTP